jgi:hypothetical protein
LAKALRTTPCAEGSEPSIAANRAPINGREADEFRLARWLMIRFGADWKFLAHFYRTGEKVRFETETGADEPLLVSVPIPRFIPQSMAAARRVLRALRTMDRRAKGRNRLQPLSGAAGGTLVPREFKRRDLEDGG